MTIVETIVETIDEMMMIIIVISKMRDANGYGISPPSSPVETVGR